MGYFRRKYARFGPPRPFHQYFLNRGLLGGPTSKLNTLRYRLHVHA